MKLIIQIPCYNEEATLAQTLADLPREIPGIDTIETLIVDDGSYDSTSEVARECGVNHIVRHRKNRGLAKSFATALDASLKHGADIIVNTDGDNQYCGADIAALVQPIIELKAHLVVGDRQTASHSEFSSLKKVLQSLGSRTVRYLSGLDIPDAVSGFRAISREAALKINVVSNFSYTIEMLLQAGDKRIATTSVPVRTNAKTRESRLFTSIPHFVGRSGTTLLRIYAMYKPLRVFLAAGSVFTLLGLVPIFRFLAFAFEGDGQGHIQSLVLGSSLLMVGVMILAMGVMADLIRNNRVLLEQTLEKVRELELKQGESFTHKPGDLFDERRKLYSSFPSVDPSEENIETERKIAKSDAHIADGTKQQRTA